MGNTPNALAGSAVSDAEAESILQTAAQKARSRAAAREAKPLLSALPDAGMAHMRIGAVMPAEQEQDSTDHRRRVEALLNASGVPKLYQRASLTRLEELEAAVAGGRVTKKEASQYREVVGKITQALIRPADRPAIVALLGMRGPGKTWIGCAAVIDHCRAGKSAFYADALDYFSALKETYNRDAKATESCVEAKHLKPDLLVLDEMHERGDTAWEDRMLTRLINKRYQSAKATILISNHDMAQFEIRVGTSISDRISDGGGVLECQWESLRGRIIERRKGA